MKKIIALTVLTSFIITSCAPAVIAVPAASVAYDERTLSTIYQDEGITHQAYGLINANKNFAESNINITSVNNLVLLVGQVPTEELKKEAEKEVKSLTEVKKVYNQITVEKTISALTKSNDAWITTKVKTSMLADIGLQSSQVKVLTENGVVYLLGIVSKDQSDQAANVASRIKGVKKVVKLFQIKTEQITTK
jgi:osmotically-inducible protein OsmY